MKKTTLLLFVLLVGLTVTSYAQAPADFFAGKWEIAVVGTPRGDVTFLTNLVRKDGKLTGELVTSVDANDKRAITRIEEAPNKITIYFESSQGGEISIELTKVDDDNLKGSLMSFDATAKRGK
ncbi:MAG: hypothetical protein EAZ91_22445 [Cytophagales bacterium]|nr:MAG: hypothetical protein EAZ91_22445 [Cytophagales bacterium]